MKPALLKRWLQKATLTTSDLTTNGGLLSPAQAREFIRVAMDEGVIAREARLETQNSPKFEVPRISFHGTRLLVNGVEATRLADADRKEPATGLVTLSTSLFRAEVPVSDETFEDNVEREGLADTLAGEIIRAVGRDVEEIAIKSDTARVAGDLDPTLDQFDGLIKKLQADLAAGQKFNATGVADPETVMKELINRMPHRYRRDVSRLRLYVPIKVADAYEEQQKDRGTPLGDRVLENGLRDMRYRGVQIVPTPIMSGTGTINAVAVDYTKFAFLTDPKNIIIGWSRRVRMERYRDAREGAMSFVVTVRFDAKFADPASATLAESIDNI